MTAPKSHLELNGWEIRRAPRPGGGEWFHLFLPWSKFPAAGGSLEHMARAIERFFAA